MKKNALILTILSLGTMPFIVHGQFTTDKASSVRTPVRYSYNGSLKYEDMQYLSKIDDAGRKLDRSQVIPLLAGLHSPKHSVYPTALMCAVARMGATEALPEYTQYIQDTNESLANYACTSRCRLLAEASVRDMPNIQKKYEKKVSEFFAESGLDTAKLNIALANRVAPMTPRSRSLHRSNPVAEPVEIYAVREIADMAYQDNGRLLVAVPSIKSINFNSDYQSALKIRLASLSRQERCTTLATELADRKTLTYDTDYDITLLADEGYYGAKVALTKLAQMAQNPDQYQSAGYIALSEVVRAVGSPSLAPMVQSLKQYPAIGSSADQLYQDVLAGRRQPRKLGY